MLRVRLVLAFVILIAAFAVPFTGKVTPAAAQDVCFSNVIASGSYSFSPSDPVGWIYLDTVSVVADQQYQFSVTRSDNGAAIYGWAGIFPYTSEYFENEDLNGSRILVDFVPWTTSDSYELWTWFYGSTLPGEFQWTLASAGPCTSGINDGRLCGGWAGYAVYTDRDSIDVYGIWNKKGFFVMSVSADELAAVPGAAGVNTLVKSSADGAVQVYRLETSNVYQVHAGADFARFTGLPAKNLFCGRIGE